MPSEERQKLQRIKDAEVKKQEGNEFYKKKDFAQALELYTAAIELNPEELLYYTNMAAVYIEQKKFDQAIAQCDTAIAKAREGAYDFVKLAKVKKETEARAYLNPEIAEAHKNKGIELFKSGDFPGAIKEFDEGLRRDPLSTALYSNRSAAFIKLLEPA